MRPAVSVHSSVAKHYPQPQASTPISSSFKPIPATKLNRPPTPLPDDPLFGDLFQSPVTHPSSVFFDSDVTITGDDVNVTNINDDFSFESMVNFNDTTITKDDDVDVSQLFQSAGDQTLDADDYLLGNLDSSSVSFPSQIATTS